MRFTERLEEIGARPSIGTVADSYDCEHRDCATTWGLTLAYDRPCGCPRVDVSARVVAFTRLLAGWAVT